MTTYFAWVQEGETFDASVHCRNDLEILELSIDHREGEVALATIIVPAANLPEWNHRFVFISSDQILLFSGRLVGLPLVIENDLISLELTAEPKDAFEKLQRLESVLKQPPYWDPGFVAPYDVDNPTEWLEARSALFSWDRALGTVCVSDLFQGRNTVDLTDVFFADSLKVRLAETPLSQISVNLTAEWIQKAEGEVSVGSRIAAAFPGGLMSTLTPDGLIATWPKEGQKIGRSGYTVVKSNLKRVKPPKTGILNVYPTVTKELRVWDEVTQKPKNIRATQFWMSGSLVLSWRYRQKRRETVRFTLKQETQLEGKIRPLIRTLNLRLQKVVPETLDTFFPTLRGRQALEHAIEIAKCHLAASARCLEVEVTLPFENGFVLSMDHCVQIKDSRIPGGNVIGKVVAYRLYQNGLKSHAWVRFAASIGGRSGHPSLMKDVMYTVPGYGDTAWVSQHQCASGLFYDNYCHQKPNSGIADIDTLSLSDILKNVYVNHDAFRQVQELEKRQYPLGQDVQTILEDIPTVISLDLLNLKTTGVLEHVIHLNIINPWRAPVQVNLEV